MMIDTPTKLDPCGLNSSVKNVNCWITYTGNLFIVVKACIESTTLFLMNRLWNLWKKLRLSGSHNHTKNSWKAKETCCHSYCREKPSVTTGLKTSERDNNDNKETKQFRSIGTERTKNAEWINNMKKELQD